MRSAETLAAVVSDPAKARDLLEDAEIYLSKWAGGHAGNSDIGDAPMLPELLSQIPPDQEIASVTADGAYDTRKCHDAIAERGPHAVIPPRKNAKPWKAITAGAVARNKALRASKYLGRALWRPLSAASCGCACRAMDGADITAEAASKPRCTV